jgi:hypothetical protein
VKIFESLGCLDRPGYHRAQIYQPPLGLTPLGA